MTWAGRGQEGQSAGFGGSSGRGSPRTHGGCRAESCPIGHGPRAPALPLLAGRAGLQLPGLFSREQTCRDEGIYLPDLAFTLNTQKVSQELLSRLIKQAGS